MNSACQVIAGPYELVKNNKQETQERISLCLMDNNSISRRNYNRFGNIMTQNQTKPLPNIEAALTAIESQIKQLQGQKFTSIEPSTNA